MGTRTAFLSTSELELTREKVKKVNARAVKRGWTGRFELSATPATRSTTGPTGLTTTSHGFDVELVGEAPCYGGWTFLAAVDATEGTPVLRYAPGAAGVVANDSVEAGRCDHCGTDRNRRHTFLLRNDDGEVVQVGRTCIKDFLGWDVIPAFIDTEKTADDLFGGSGGGHGDHDTIEVLRWAMASTRVDGFRPASFSGSTVDQVREVMHNGRRAKEVADHLRDHLPTVEEALVAVDEVMVGLTGEGGYEANLRAVASGVSVACNHLGLLCSLPAALDRLHGKQAERKARAEASAASEHFGTIGEKVEFTATITRATTMDGYHYGTSQLLLVMVTDDGNQAKCFTSAGWAADVEVGDEVHLLATVKDHTEYRGTKETLVTRAKPVAG